MSDKGDNVECMLCGGLASETNVYTFLCPRLMRDRYMCNGCYDVVRDAVLKVEAAREELRERKERRRAARDEMVKQVHEYRKKEGLEQ